MVFLTSAHAPDRSTPDIGDHQTFMPPSTTISVPVTWALALARSDRIGVDDLPPELGAAPPTVQTADDVRTLAEVERDYIVAALRASGGNRAKAAEKLGIGAATLYRKLKQARP